MWVVETTSDFMDLLLMILLLLFFKLDSIILCGGISDFNAGIYFKSWYFYSYILKNKLYFKNVFRNVF